MTLRSLEIFVTLATYKNMTKTAEKLFLTQSSISQVISQIESEYKVILFDRLKNGLELTSVGNDMLGYAKSILNLYDELESVLKKDSDNPRIRIGASVNIGLTILESIVTELIKEIPNLQYTTYCDNTKSIQDKLASNELDIGIVDGVITNKDILSETLTDDKMILICAPKHRFNGMDEVSLEEIVKEPLILREESSGARKQLLDVMKDLNEEPKIIWTATSGDVVKQAVKKNLGISVLSKRLVEEDLANGSLYGCGIKDVNLRREFKLIYHKDKFFTNTMKTFKEIVEEIAKK